MSDELELLFNKDVPVVPEVEFDYKKMLQNCKMGKEKHNIKLFKYVLNACFCAILCLIFVLTTVIIIKNNTSIEKKDKIEIVRSSGYVVSGNDSLGSTWHIGPYGIEVLIKCDFTKHPKYNEWVEECGPIALEDMNENSDGRFSYEFYLNRQLLKKYYEEIKNDYPNHTGYVLEAYEGFVRLQFYILPSDGETIEEAIEKNDNYFNDFLKSNEYNNLVELAETNYICSIMIGQMDVSLQGNE